MMDEWLDDGRFSAAAHNSFIELEHFVDERLEEDEEDVEPQEVLSRIECCILEFLEQLFYQQSAPDISVGTVMTRNGTRERTRSLMARQGQGAHGYARLFSILEIAYELTSLGMIASQRDVFYRLKTLDIFKTPEQVNQAIQDVASMVQVPSMLLGFSCASRGAVYGPLLVQEEAAGEWMDCSMCARNIPGNSRVVSSFGFQSPAKFVVVVEKDAIFQRLVDDGFAEHIGGILVTAKGMPDMATRAFLHALTQALPHLTPLAVVDWNPAGVNIYCVYKYGSTRRHSEHYGLSGLTWLAARAALLHGVPNHVLQGPLTTRDKALTMSLKAGPLSAEPAVLAELDAMLEMDAKAEIEALYEKVGIDNFTASLAQSLFQQYGT